MIFCRPKYFSAANKGFNVQDFLDIVKSQGAFLIPRPPSPIHQRHDTNDFISTLHTKLEWLIRGNEVRRRKYGDAAYEWPPGRTPTELVEKRAVELDNMIAIMEASSPSECFDNEEGDLKQKEKEEYSYNRLHWLEQSSFPTPSPSIFKSIPNPTFSYCRSILPNSEIAMLEAKSRKKQQQPYDLQEKKQHKKRRTIPAGPDRQYPPSNLDSTRNRVRARGKMRRRDNKEGACHKRSWVGEDRLRRSARLRRYYENDYINYRS